MFVTMSVTHIQLNRKLIYFKVFYFDVSLMLS